MKKLPNKITTDTQLNDWCNRHIGGFVGVYDRTKFGEIYPHMSPGDSVILNLDPNYANNGTHWVALRISSEAPLVYYKDSFGTPPPSDVSNIMRSQEHSRGLVYGNRINQGLNETNCGKRAATFLYDMYQAAKKNMELEHFLDIELGG